MGRKSLGLWIGFGVLAVALAALAVLLPLAFRGGGPTTTFAVGQFENTPCSLSQEQARCYTAVVTNTGEHAAFLSCHLIDLGGAPATFLSEETTYQSPNVIEAKASVPLTIRLVPSSGSSPALPQLTCEAA